MSLDHQEGDLELKLPVTTDKDGLRLFMSFKKFSKLDINESNSSVLWMITRINFYPSISMKLSGIEESR